MTIERRLLGPDSERLAYMTRDLAWALAQNGKLDEAIQLTRDSLASSRKLQEADRLDHHVSHFAERLTSLLAQRGKLAEAEQISREIVTLQRESLGPDTEQAVLATINLAWVLQQEQKLDEAVQLARDALATSQKLQDPVTREQRVTTCQLNLGIFLANQDKPAEAEPVLRESVANATRLWPTSFDGWSGGVYAWLYVIRRQGKPEACSAITDLLRVESLDSSAKESLLEVRADLSGRGGRWKEAAADYAKLIEIEPTNHWFYHQVAPVLLITGDLGAYHAHCRRALARFASTQEPAIAERMAIDCLLLPPAAADLPTVSRLAALATQATNDPSLPFFQATKGLAEYRQGHFAEAMEWSQKPLAPAGRVVWRDARAYPVLAMAQHQLKHAEEARAALAKAIELTETKLPRLDSTDLGTAWDDVLRDHLLLREARALIEGDAAHSPDEQPARPNETSAPPPAEPPPSLPESDSNAWSPLNQVGI